MQPIPIISFDQKYDTLTNTVFGWGTTSEEGVSSNILQKVAVDEISNDLCNNYYQDVTNITEEMVCAFEPSGGKDRYFIQISYLYFGVDHKTESSISLKLYCYILPVKF